MFYSRGLFDECKSFLFLLWALENSRFVVQTEPLASAEHCVLGCLLALHLKKEIASVPRSTIKYEVSFYPIQVRGLCFVVVLS